MRIAIGVRRTPLVAFFSSFALNFFNICCYGGCCAYSYWSKKNPSRCSVSSCALDFFHVCSYGKRCVHNCWSKLNPSCCSITSCALEFFNGAVKEGVVPRAFGIRRTPLAGVEISCCRLQFSNVWSYCRCGAHNHCSMKSTPLITVFPVVHLTSPISVVMAGVVRIAIGVRRTALVAVLPVVHLNYFMSAVKEGVVPRAFGVRRIPIAAVEISCCRLQFSNVWSYCRCCAHNHCSMKSTPLIAVFPVVHLTSPISVVMAGVVCIAIGERRTPLVAVLAVVVVRSLS